MGANLVAKLVLLADGTQVKGESVECAASLDKLTASAERAGAAGVTMGRGIGVATKAIVEDTAATAALTAETVALSEAQVGVAINTRAALGVTRLAAREAGIGRAQFAGLVNTWKLLADHPVAAAITGVTAALIAGAVAVDAYDTSFRRAQGTALATGNIFGVDREQLEKLAAQIEETAGVSTREAARMESAFLGAGLSPDRWNKAAEAAKLLARVWQTDIPTAAARLAQAIDDPKANVEELFKDLGGLDPALKSLVEDLVTRGDRDHAVDKILERVVQQLHDMPNTASGVKQLFDAITTDLSKAATTTGEWLSKLTSFDAPDWLVFLMRQGSAAGHLAIGDLAGAAALEGQRNANRAQFSGVTQTPGLDLAWITARQLQSERELANLRKTTADYGTDQNQKRIDQLSNEAIATQQLIDILGKMGGNEKEIAANEQKLTNIHNDIARARKAQKDALLALNPAEKQHQELVQAALKDGERLVASSSMESAAQEGITAAASKGVLALQKANDEYAIQKAVLPLVTAQQYAHGAAWQKLQVDIDAVTAAMRRQQVAQHEGAAIQQIRAGVSSLSGTAFGGVDFLGVSYRIGQAIKEAVELREQLRSALRDGVSDEDAARIELIFRDKISKPINDAIDAVRSGIAGLSENAGAEGLALMFRESVKEAERWRDSTRAAISGAQEALDTYINGGGGDLQKYDALLTRVFGADYRDHLQEASAALDEYASHVDLIFNDKLARAKDDDLDRSKAWAAGVERAYRDITRNTEDWAKTSEGLARDLNSEIKNELLDMAAGGKTTVDDLWQFFIKKMLEALYRASGLEQSFNTIFAELLKGLGSIFSAMGLPGIGGVEDVQMTGSYGGAGSLGVPVGHKGLLVGGPANDNRTVSAAVFAGAQRFHGGGRIGPDEVPIIAKRGERVLNIDQNRAWEMGGAPVVINLPASAMAMPKVNFNVTNNHPDAKVSEGRHTMGPDGSMNIEMFIDQVDHGLAERHMRGRSAFGSTMANVHGLKRGLS